METFSVIMSSNDVEYLHPEGTEAEKNLLCLICREIPLIPYRPCHEDPFADCGCFLCQDCFEGWKNNTGNSLLCPHCRATCFRGISEDAPEKEYQPDAALQRILCDDKKRILHTVLFFASFRHGANIVRIMHPALIWIIMFVHV